jgi:predicted glycoside hydrolase/deacetylase ChbG (UPF0249 family)
MHLHLLPGILESMIGLAQHYRIAALRVPQERLSGWGDLPRLVSSWRCAILTSLSTLQMRRISRTGLFYPDRIAGIAESGRLTEDALLRILQRLKPGMTEIMVHPGYCDGVLNAWPQSRQYPREQELRALTSPKVRARVQNLRVRLVGYRTVLE